MRKILAITSGRADGTPLDPVIKATGAHPMFVGDCTFAQAATRIGEWVWTPDLMLVLGDRFEVLAAVAEATVAGIPIAHIHGGETTVGSFDNQIRDAISKLAHIHFVAAEQFRDKLISIGESPERIHVVGAPGLDNLVALPPRKPGKYFVVTYHPETLGETDPWPIIRALDEFPRYTVHWTSANNDPKAEVIDRAMRHRVNWTDETYRYMCRNAAVVIGNSSSGLIEMPTLEVPTVNVGDRQKGRPCGPSVFNCPNEKMAIVAAVKAALEYDGPYTNPYGGPGASKKIADILLNAKIDMRKDM